MNRTNTEDIFHKRTALAIIIGFSFIRCAIAFSMELGTDEAYYWLYSQNLEWNYFDHPPMVAAWIRAFTANLAFENIEGLVRLGSVVGCAVASWAIYKTGETLNSSKAGLFGVCLYHASFFAFVTAGIFIMPDAPQMVFYTLSLWVIACIIKDGRSWLSWLTFGVLAGLCIMSKVYGAFLWAGLGLFAIVQKREWLLRPHIYAAFGVTVLIASPILIWNFQNSFFTFRFHSGRIAENKGGLDITSFCRELVNQFLYNNPTNVLAIIAAYVAFLKRRKEKDAEYEALSLFTFIALPQAVLFLGLSLFGVLTLPHWSGPAYVALIPLAAINLNGRPFRYAKKILLVSVSGLFLFLAAWQYLIHYAPDYISKGNDGPQIFETNKEVVPKLFSGFANFQLVAKTSGSWEPASKAFLMLYQQETVSGKMEKNSPVICYKWWGAHIEYYFCHPANIPMIGVGEPNELHQYLFTNAERKDHANLNTAYCIVPADDNYDVQSKYSPYYQKIGKPTLITVTRKGKLAVKFYIFRLSGWKNRLPVVEN